MVVEESPGRHALRYRVGALQRVGRIGQQLVLVPLVRVVTRDVDIQVIGLAIGDGVATTLEVTVAGPVVEAGVVARVEVLAAVVFEGVSQAGGEAQRVDGAELDVEVFHDLRILGEVLCAEARIVERVVVGEHATVGTRSGVVTQHLAHIAVLVVGCKVGVHAHVVAERAVGAVVGAVACHAQRVAEHPLAVAVREVHVTLHVASARLLHHTGHVVISYGGRVAHLVGTSLDVGRVLLSDAGAQRLRQPVGVHATGDVGRDGIVLLVELCLVVGHR